MGFAQAFFKKKKSKDAIESSTSISIQENNKQNGSRSPSFQSRRSPSFHSSSIPIEELEQVFKKFDVNGDGKISSSELGSIMGSLGQEITEEELQFLIKEVDADGDGFIDLHEFITLNTTGVDSHEIMHNLREAFAIYDADGNGNITAEELQMVMKSLGDDYSIGECKKMISGVDRDGDGTIDFEEFKVMMMMGARLDTARAN